MAGFRRICVLTPDASLPTHLQFCPFPTSTTKCLPSRQRELVAHCITPVAEKIVSAEGVDIARWLSVYHLIPRLLLLSSLHKRMNIDTPSVCHPPSSTFRTPSRGRRVGAPRDLAGDAFETRVRASLSQWPILRASLFNSRSHHRSQFSPESVPIPLRHPPSN